MCQSGPQYQSSQIIHFLIHIIFSTIHNIHTYYPLPYHLQYPYVPLFHPYILFPYHTLMFPLLHSYHVHPHVFHLQPPTPIPILTICPPISPLFATHILTTTSLFSPYHFPHPMLMSPFSILTMPTPIPLLPFSKFSFPTPLFHTPHTHPCSPSLYPLHPYSLSLLLHAHSHVLYSQIPNPHPHVLLPHLPHTHTQPHVPIPHLLHSHPHLPHPYPHPHVPLPHLLHPHPHVPLSHLP